MVLGIVLHSALLQISFFSYSVGFFVLFKTNLMKYVDHVVVKFLYIKLFSKSSFSCRLAD